MKIALILLAAFTMISCKKDETTYCWSCEYNGFKTGSYIPSPVTVCDKTETEITQYQIDNELTCSKL